MINITFNFQKTPYKLIETYFFITVNSFLFFLEKKITLLHRSSDRHMLICRERTSNDSSRKKQRTEKPNNDDIGYFYSPMMTLLFTTK
jgi:hypothetical protein